jgi:enterochelin esterase-like enzyme
MNKLLVVLLLATCAAPQTSAAPGTVSEISTAAAQVTEVQATATAAAALAANISKDEASATAMDACAAAGGQIEQFKIDSQYLDAGLRFRVYTPPCYQENMMRLYPVLYLVHGQTFNDDQWDRLGVDEAADQLISGGEIAPFIIVMPYDISSNQPSRDHFGDAVVEELLTWIEANYRSLDDREHRAIGGLSRGASWAIHLGLTHPELFGAMGAHSPPVFVEDASKVRGWLDNIPAELMPRIWLDIGARDQRAILDSAKWFEGLLDERDIPHDWSLFSGDHSEAYWSAHVDLYLRWYAAEW